MMPEAIRKSPHEPYRYLFPAGVLASFVGVLLWLAFQWGWLEFYPRQAHANLMFFGFIWAFVSGFLMTAVPKMTGDLPANQIEINIALGLVALQVILNLLNEFSISFFLVGLQTLYILYFVGRRFIQGRRIPFEGFIFFPFAIVQIFVALFFFWFSKSMSTDRFYLLAGEAFLLNLVLGIGTRLIPTISRVKQALSPHEQADVSKFGKMLAMAILLNMGFWLHFFGFETLGLGLRFITVLFISVFYLKVLAPMMITSILGWGLRIGVMFILFSYGMSLVDPRNAIAVQHFLYIGGFVLITFMVGTRVMLAHGGQDLTYEIGSKRIGFVILMLALASLIRFIAGTEIMGPLMTVSIVFFLTAALVWIHKFVRILLKS